jgi:hypothetical protein
MKMLRVPAVGSFLYTTALYGVNAAFGWLPVETEYLLISSAFMFFALFTYELVKAWNAHRNHSAE